MLRQIAWSLFMFCVLAGGVIICLVIAVFDLRMAVHQLHSLAHELAVDLDMGEILE